MSWLLVAVFFTGYCLAWSAYWHHRYEAEALTLGVLLMFSVCLAAAV